MILRRRSFILLSFVQTDFPHQIMPGARPLLSSRASSDVSGDRDIAEEDALLTGRPTQRAASSRPRTWKFWREIGLFVWAVVATAAVIILAVVFQQRAGPERKPQASGKKNLIFMVSDGMGPTSLSLTRSFMQFQNGAPFSEQLVIDQHLIGQSRTRSSSSLITDSAAGATAFSCAQKSYNGAISVTPDHEPCGTVLEAAKKAGYMTGLVVTTRITDATPACFAAHVNMRTEEDRIAEQMVGEHPLGRVVDLMFGGGRCHFLPNSTVESSCRADGRDIVGLAKKNGFNYVSDRAGFDNLKGGAGVDLPMLGLFADTDIPYEIDRRNENNIYPSLHEMAEAAMTALSDATRDSEKGFFLMIEGSRIDHAGHHNDPAAQVHEVLAYDRTFTSVLEFIDKEDTPTLMVSTSDHETGGLATARRKFRPYNHQFMLTPSQNYTPPTLNTCGTPPLSPTPPTPPNACILNTPNICYLPPQTVKRRNSSVTLSPLGSASTTTLMMKSKTSSPIPRPRCTNTQT